MNPFEFHTGIEYEEQGDQFVGQCPFCEKEDKFYFNKDNMWDCKNSHCVTHDNKRRSGNLIIFLRQLHEAFDTKTKASELVSDVRDITLNYVMKFNLVWNPLNDSILFPTYSHDKINNIYKISIQQQGGKTKLIPFATPTMEHTLINAPESCTEDLWIAEGHWDRIALEQILHAHPEITRTAVPGAGVWKKTWTSYLDGKNIVFLYDNDNAGRTGYEKIILKEIARSNQKPKSVQFLKWPEGLQDGFDVNDILRKEKKNSFAFIKENLSTYETDQSTVIVKTTIETVAPNKSIDTFDKLVDEYQKIYHTTEDMKMGLLLVLTSLYSLNIEGEQLWLRIIGPPSCGKTTIAKTVGASERTVLKSTFTGLFSGWADDSDEDASLIPIIANKLLMVKDADALLQQPNIEKIFSELRDFYDKDSSTQFKNRIKRDYRNIRSGMVLFGTNVLRRSDQSFLGERFLDFELRISKKDKNLIENKVLQRSIDVALDSSNIPPETPVQAAARGFIDFHLLERQMTHAPSTALREAVLKRARIAALMRTKVDREMFGRGDITFQPVPELAARLIGQYMKVAMCAPIVLSSADAEKQTIKLINKITYDIIDPTSSRFKVCQDLQEGWFTRDGLVESTGLSPTIVTRELDNLRALDLVDKKIGHGSRPGAKVPVFTLEESIKEQLMELNQV